MEENKVIVIKGKDDKEKLSVPISSKCVYRKTKMQDEYVLLDFNSNVLIPFAKGDYIVTEYGVAKLRGATIRERAQRLIAIAHPDFRKELEEQAKEFMLW